MFISHFYLFSFFNSFHLCLSSSLLIKHTGSSCVFAPLYVHALLISLFSLCVQARFGTPTLDELGREPAEDCIGQEPWQRLRTSPCTDDYEKITKVKLREWHGLVYAAARKMLPADASAATPSADSQMVRQRPGPRNAGRTRERTSSTFPSVRGTATAVARTTLRGDGPAPRAERSLRSRKHLQQRRNPRNDRSHSGRILLRLWLRNDAEFKLPCRWSRGRRPTARRPMSRSTRIRARTGTRATAKRLPASSRIRTPSFDSFSLAPGTRAWPPCWRRKKQERDELKVQLRNCKPLHRRLRLATEATAKASKVLEVAKREEADVELLALKRAEVDQFKATLLQHNNNVELLELRYRTEAGSAELRHFESPGVQTVAAPLSPIQWAAGFRNCLNAEARDVIDAFCLELEQSLDSAGPGPTAETPAPEKPPAAGAFPPFPRFRAARMDPYLAPPPQGVPWDSPAFIPAGISALVHNDDWCG